MKKYLAFGLAVALLALAGGLIVALNSAKATTAKATEPAATTVDTDSLQVQSGDQSSPDVITAVAASEQATTIDSDNVQSGDQSSADVVTAAAASETATPAESTGDQPGDAQPAGGGHQDTPGANVDWQFNGVE